MSQDDRNLIVWQKAIELTVCVYQLTVSFPKSELYGLASQMQRASISVASNIAEGRGRLNPAEFRQFLGVAPGSVYELETQLTIAQRLGLSTSEAVKKAASLSNEVSKMLSGLIQTVSIQTRTNKLAASRSKLAARS